MLIKINIKLKPSTNPLSLSLLKKTTINLATKTLYFQIKISKRFSSGRGSLVSG